jgi:hypothetical protein
MSKVYESRWGFHPVSREECAELKEAHRIFLRAYQDVKRYIRWERKDPDNRRGPEPRHCGPFLEYGYHKLDEKEFHGWGFKRVRDCDGKFQNYYLHILRAYQQARRPCAKAEDVQPLDLPEGWRDEVKKLQAFYQVDMVAA